MTQDVDLEALLRRFTPKQRAKLARLDRAPWSWFVSDAYFFRLVEEYDRDSRIRYWQVLNRCTTYQGEDYRIRLQDRWIRATRTQYDQALDLGIERSIGVPTPALIAA